VIDIKYHTRGLICDVNNYCALSCDMGDISLNYKI